MLSACAVFLLTGISWSERQMASVFRRPALIALAAVGLVVAVVVVLLNQDPDRYRQQVAGLLSDAAGYPVSLAGPLTLRWRPVPALMASDVLVAVPGANVSVASVELRADPIALLTRKLRIERVEVRKLLVDLEDAIAVDGGPASIPDPAQLPVQELVVDDAVVMRNGERLFSITWASLREPGASRGARLDVNFPVAGATVEGKARVRVNPGRVELSEISLHTAPGLVEGRLSLALDGPRPRLGGEIAANALSFRPRAAGAGDRLIARIPVDLSVLEFVDGALRVHVGRLNLDGIRVHDVSVPVTLKDGRLEVRGRGVYAGGAASATLAVSAPDATWSVQAALQDADAGDALVMLGLTQAESGGRLAMTTQLRAAGSHTDDILASLEGRLTLDAAGVNVRAGAAQLAGSDVIASVLRALRGESGDRLSLECAVGRFSVRNGVLIAREGIGAQSRTMNLLGGGRISLMDERMDLALRPWPREGLGLSASAVVGTVAISGPLLDPDVGLTSEAAWRGGATAGAAFFTGGLSLIVQGLFERARGDAPCAQAAGNSGPGLAGNGGSRTGDTGGSSTSDSLGDAVRGLGDRLKGMFGNGRGGDRPGAGRADN